MSNYKMTLLWRTSMVLGLGLGIAVFANWHIKKREIENRLPIRYSENVVFSDKMFDDPEAIEKRPVRVDAPLESSELAVVPMVVSEERFSADREAGSPDREQLNRYISTWDGLRNSEIRDPNSETNRQLANALMETRRARLVGETE